MPVFGLRWCGWRGWCRWGVDVVAGEWIMYVGEGLYVGSEWSRCVVGGVGVEWVGGLDHYLEGWGGVMYG